MNDIDIYTLVNDINTILHNALAKTMTLKDATPHLDNHVVDYNARLLYHHIHDAIAIILSIDNDITVSSL